MDQVNRNNDIINQIAQLLNNVNPDGPPTPIQFAVEVANATLALSQEDAILVAAQIENTLFLCEGTIH